MASREGCFGIPAWQISTAGGGGYGSSSG
ncbi:hypothetical protein CCACVL1_27639 [Corchorus capsularis]|uniref:Uncharacterized protein n=1 Tax=Corchorus capsularis TaxID=210143 RepID=A0A1R3G9C8_COCAP|nr:hypothetical protein CCACVL1_27639 [Corchorus capsularis]